jgi:riboflavin kinase
MNLVTDLPPLLALAKRGCCEGSVEVSSQLLGSELGMSQQTASRRLRRLEKEGYITREVHPRGQRVRFTSRGIKALRELHRDLEEIFSVHESEVYYITGEVFSGLGEGRYYMQIKGYMEQFMKKLGFNPFPGTLNLRLKTEEDIGLKERLMEYRGIIIDGFENGDRTYGSARCYPAELKGVKGAVIIPSRSHYTLSTLEFIAPDNVREKADLKDGDIVSIKVRAGGLK